MTRFVRVVVVGAGPAGLLAAGALAAYADEVVVLDRDRLPREPVPRDGVPQDRHWNQVDRQAVAAIEDLLPGITAEAVAAGARRDLGGLAIRRPLAEALVRRRVAALPRVRLLGRTSALDLVLDRGERRVRGVVVTAPDQDSSIQLPADLVIDASGQHTRIPAWLARRGIDMTEDRVRINATFVTREFTRNPSPVEPLVMRHLVPDGEGHGDWARSAVVMAVGDRWLVTLGGAHGRRPPTDLPGFTSYASAVCESLEPLLRGRPTVGDPAVHRLPATVTRRVDRPADFPAGLMLTGDARQTRDPLSGAGLTAAAGAATVLADAVRHTAVRDLGQALFERPA